MKWILASSAILILVGMGVWFFGSEKNSTATSWSLASAPAPKVELQRVPTPLPEPVEGPKPAEFITTLPKVGGTPLVITSTPSPVVLPTPLADDDFDWALFTQTLENTPDLSDEESLASSHQRLEAQGHAVVETKALDDEWIGVELSELNFLPTQAQLDQIRYEYQEQWQQAMTLLVAHLNNGLPETELNPLRSLVKNYKLPLVWLFHNPMDRYALKESYVSALLIGDEAFLTESFVQQHKMATLQLLSDCVLCPERAKLTRWIEWDPQSSDQDYGGGFACFDWFRKTRMSNKQQMDVSQLLKLYPNCGSPFLKETYESLSYTLINNEAELLANAKDIHLYQLSDELFKNYNWTLPDLWRWITSQNNNINFSEYELANFLIVYGLYYNVEEALAFNKRVGYPMNRVGINLKTYYDLLKKAKQHNRLTGWQELNSYQTAMAQPFLRAKDAQGQYQSLLYWMKRLYDVANKPNMIELFRAEFDQPQSAEVVLIAGSPFLIEMALGFEVPKQELNERLNTIHKNISSHYGSDVTSRIEYFSFRPQSFYLFIVEQAGHTPFAKDFSPRIPAHER